MHAGSAPGLVGISGAVTPPAMLMVTCAWDAQSLWLFNALLTLPKTHMFMINMRIQPVQRKEKVHVGMF